MEYINGYKAEESLYTKDGKEISVLRLEVENEEKVLDEWATHFREQYRYMEDLDFERHGTRRTRQEHLRDYVFPSDSVRPGPSIRVGDFCEILVADEKYVAGSRKEIVNLIKRDSNIRRKIEGVLQNYPTYFSFKFEEIVYE